MPKNAIEKLNENQYDFMINYFVKNMTQEDAYLEAGYNAKPGNSAKAAASQLANNDKIKKAVKELDTDEFTEPNKKIGELQISDKIRDAINTLSKLQKGEFDNSKKARVMKESAVEILDRAGIMKKKPQSEEGQLNFNFDLSASEAREIEADFAELDDE